MTELPDVWAASDAPPPGDAPNDAAGGTHVPVAQLFSETLEDFQTHWKGYLMTGLGLTAVAIPVLLLLVAVAMAPMLIGMVAENDWIVSLGLFWYIGALLIGGALVLAPLNAGLFRVVNRHLDGDGDALRFGAIFGALTQDLVPTVVLHLLIALATGIGLLLCYLPALVVSLALALALPALVVHRMGATAAFGRSVRHFREHFGWHLGFSALGMAILMLAANVPLVGYALGMPLYAAYHLRGYRAVFGRGRAQDHAADPQSG